LAELGAHCANPDRATIADLNAIFRKTIKFVLPKQSLLFPEDAFTGMLSDSL